MSAEEPKNKSKPLKRHSTGYSFSASRWMKRGYRELPEEMAAPDLYFRRGGHIHRHTAVLPQRTERR